MPHTHLKQDGITIQFDKQLKKLGFNVTIRGIWASVGSSSLEYGWKLHLSSVGWMASSLLERIASILFEHGCAFKGGHQFPGGGAVCRRASWCVPWETLRTAQGNPPTRNRLRRAWEPECHRHPPEIDGLRKTWGYWQRMERGTAVPLLMEAFGHATQQQTLAYLGIQADEIAKIYDMEL